MLFIVRDGEIITPPHDSSLESITQNSVITLARDLGFKVIERNITRDEVYIADEAFFTGTAAEITPISRLDSRIIGNGGRGNNKNPSESFFDIVYGRNSKYSHWLTYID